ncbi:hypothetical protein GQ607_011795 [Colletotrichum asianum]|uniref:Uncharacterized protein n=1 Tax=Colletotrichum asianum TaxID=702518 RepID=A0A8H3W461_9PEZI|nr:hypothetical protein GQ607_011795 [Colletotrichum asianum]
MNIQGVTITCSAALLLIFATVSHIQRPGCDDMGVQLSACFRALDEFSSSWENAKRAHDFLIMLQRQWEIRARSNRLRRQSSATSSTPRKRLRKDSVSYSSPRDYSPASTTQPSKRQQHHSPQAQANADAMGAELGIDLDWIFAVDNSAGLEAFLGTWGLSKSYGI